MVSTKYSTKCASYCRFNIYHTFPWCQKASLYKTFSSVFFLTHIIWLSIQPICVTENYIPFKTSSLRWWNIWRRSVLETVSPTILSWTSRRFCFCFVLRIIIAGFLARFRTAIPCVIFGCFYWWFLSSQYSDNENNCKMNQCLKILYWGLNPQPKM